MPLAGVWTRTAFMVSWRTLLGVALVLALLGGGLRFFRLGSWSYTGDELAAFEEERSLYAGEPTPEGSQADRLPRLLPLGYLTLYVGDSLFGPDEFGSRVAVALL